MSIQKVDNVEGKRHAAILKAAGKSPSDGVH